MKKSIATIAIISFMMIFPSSANAGWLDVIKAVIGLPAAPQPAASVAANAQPASSVPAAPSPAAPAASPAPATPSGGPPTDEQINAALDSLKAVCKKVSSKIPCGVGIGRGAARSTALEDANEKSIADLARSMGTFVKINTTEIYKKIDDDDDFEEGTNKERVTQTAVEQEVKGSQGYLSYTYQVKKGNKLIFEVIEVRVLNPALFEKALTEVSQGKSLSSQLVDESISGFASMIKKSIMKK